MGKGIGLRLQQLIPLNDNLASHWEKRKKHAGSPQLVRKKKGKGEAVLIL